jgi:hypothetical protein
MSEGYAYTSISVRPGKPATVGMSLYLDGATWIEVYGAGEGKPHLNISVGEASVNICPQPQGVTAGDARIARRLADKAAAYAAEIERLADASEADASEAAAGGSAAA